MKILSIETSCDETAASVVEFSNNSTNVQSNVISSQVELHAQWGGVVPNLAAREHTKNIIPVITEALETADTSSDDINLISVTHGPGLIPALLSGVSATKALAYSWKKPLMGVHHIEGHIYANWINNPNIKFPALALVVSGGHTQLVLMQDHCNYEIIGQTQDDAVGEAFDKVSRMLGLGYPGGPIISERSKIFEQNNSDNKVTLPQPMKHSGDYNFSFSGIKTAALYLVKNYRKENNLSDDATLPQEFIDSVAHAFQTTTTEILTEKTLKASEQHNVESILLAGGVSANVQLRDSLKKAIENSSNTKFYAPNFEYCLDNAAMIAIATYYRWNNLSQIEKNDLSNGWKDISAYANLNLTS